MISVARFRLVFALVALGLVLQAAPSSAAFQLLLRHRFTSTGPGTCGIIIEPFAEPNGPTRPGSSALESGTYKINVPIPNGSTASNSATLVRNGVDAVLPGDFTVTILPGDPDYVKVQRSTGSFTMSVSEDIPAQIIDVTSAVVPGMGPPGAVLLGAMLLAAGAAIMLRRRHRGHA